MFSLIVVMSHQAQSPAPLERPPQHTIGLDTAHAPQGGHRCAHPGLQGHGSKQPAPVDPACEGEWIRWSPEVFSVLKNGCPCSSSTALYFNGFCKAGLKITSIIQQNSKFNWGIHKKLEASTQFFTHQFRYNKKIPTESKTLHLQSSSQILGSNINHFL